MFYQEKLPCPILRPYINCFWVLRSPQPASIRDRTFPDGCQEIAFSVDSTVLRDDRNGSGYYVNPKTELIGQMTRPYDVLTHGKNLHFGIKFYPHSFSRFTSESIYDLRDQSIDLLDLMVNNFQSVIDEVYERPTFNQFVNSMQGYFLECLADCPRYKKSYSVVDHAVGILMREKTATRIDALPKLVGIGERALQNMFKHHVGLSPKQLLKMIRFQTTFRFLKDARFSLTAISQICGYYDHAHFTHEFTTFSGVSPSVYRATEYPLNQFFLNETSYAYLCNYKDLSDTK